MAKPKLKPLGPVGKYGPVYWACYRFPGGIFTVTIALDRT